MSYKNSKKNNSLGQKKVFIFSLLLHSFILSKIMDNSMNPGGFSLMPPVVKNLLIINGIFYLATFLLAQRGIDLVSLFGMHIIGANDFKPWQIITYMFMHGNFGHIFFNMFALWMFGAVIENSLGSRRFLFYYLVTGIGAAIIHYIVIYFQIHPTLALINQFLDNPSLETYKLWAENNTAPEFKTMVAQNWAHLQYNPDSLVELINITFTARNNYLNEFVVIGASGSVFGLLLAFGMMFPNNKIYIYFLIPIKAKWFVVIYGAIELVYGVAGTADGIGHFAHLGGMLFGFILLMIWRKKREI